MQKKLLIGISFLIIFYSTVVLAASLKKEEESPEKKEYKRIMKLIDKNYKSMQGFMGLYPDQLGKKQWGTFLNGGQEISRLAKLILDKFPRPDDETYQKLMKKMRKHAEEVVKAAKKKYEGAYEDIQYSHGRLRNACKKCHNHLNIQIYTSLYPKKEEELPPPLD
ncbi:MAG: hypothetical protein ACUZ77_04375 [Candidatus Brocadiales bacterium]